MGNGSCVGDTTIDPVGATFDELYNGHFFYVVWNDQFYDDPLPIKGAPAGHSKGMLAWNENGDGIVLQVSTPSWPGAGMPAKKRGLKLALRTPNSNSTSVGTFVRGVAEI